LGKPDNISRGQIRSLRERAAATRKETFDADAAGNFKRHHAIEPWGVALIREVS